MKSNVFIQKKNEVYLTVKCEPHVGYELADQFTFEVPAAKFMSAYKTVSYTHLTLPTMS